MTEVGARGGQGRDSCLLAQNVHAPLCLAQLLCEVNLVAKAEHLGWEGDKKPD